MFISMTYMPWPSSISNSLASYSSSVRSSPLYLPIRLPASIDRFAKRPCPLLPDCFSSKSVPTRQPALRSFRQCSSQMASLPVLTTGFGTRREAARLRRRANGTHRRGLAMGTCEATYGGAGRIGRGAARSSQVGEISGHFARWVSTFIPPKAPSPPRTGPPTTICWPRTAASACRARALARRPP